MKFLAPIILLFGIFAMTLFMSDAEESVEVDKRYVAALAKNGRLPKFANAQKKDRSQQESVQSSENTDEDYSKDTLVEEKRHLGAFLKQHGKPNFMRTSSFDDASRDEKRNIASMARLGRLNAFRYARMQPFNVGGKRMSSEEISNNDEDNTINAFEDPDCLETEEFADNGNDNRPIWVQKKRYVAALARSGRLPIWHSQRMWSGGKRDDSRPFSSNRKFESIHENALDEMPFAASKNKRCKKVYGYQVGKKNVASLARNGKLRFGSNA